MTAQNDSITPAEPFAASEAHAAIHAAAGEAVAELIGEGLIATVAFRDETTLVVERERIRDILMLLRERADLGFDRLSDLSAIDYLDAPALIGAHHEARFAVVYHLMSRRTLARLRVRAMVPEDDPWITSVTDLFPMANWPEREVFDLMGITFAGHPDLKRLLLPDDWDGNPLRKDYPIGAEEIQFSFNEAEIAAQYPQTPEEREDRYFVARPLNN